MAVSAFRGEVVDKLLPPRCGESRRRFMARCSHRCGVFRDAEWMSKMSAGLAYTFFGLAMSFGVTAAILYHVLVERCNEQLPEERRLSHFFGTPGFVYRDIKTYRELFPNGRLHAHLLLAMALGVVFFVLGLILDYSVA